MATKKTPEKKAVPLAQQTKEEKKKALETAIAQLEKTYGAGVVVFGYCLVN